MKLMMLHIVIFSIGTLAQLYNASCKILTTPQTTFLLILSLLFIIAHFKTYTKYYAFLNKSITLVGKVIQDNYSFTLAMIVYSLNDIACANFMGSVWLCLITNQLGLSNCY